MASQDRTSEFFSLCQSLPPPPPNSKPLPAPPSSSLSTGRYQSQYNLDATDELRTFHQTASILSREIYSTSTLLSELTSLIHSRSGSLFVDESSKVNNLVLRIKNNIESLNSKLDASNEMIQRNKRYLGKNSQAGMEASNLVGQLQEEFVNTTKGFKEVLMVRSERIKERSDRESGLMGERGEEMQERVSLLGNKPKIYASQGDAPRQGAGNGNGNGSGSGNGNGSGSGNGNRYESGLNSFGSGGVGGGGLSLAAAGPRLDLTSAMMQNSGQMQTGESTTQLPRPYGIKENAPNYSPSTGIRLRHGSSFSNNDNPSPLPVYTPLDIQRMEEQSGQSQQMQLIPDQNYLRERADAMTAVETNIVELGTIFNKLAVMVNEHSEMVQRVEDNVDDANDNIMLSLGTLTDTLHNLTSNRQLFFRMLAVMVVFIIFFITFFA